MPESFDVNLEREAYGFISEKHKIIFNENGIRTTRLIANVFSEYNCLTIASEEMNQGSKKFVWMKNGFLLFVARGIALLIVIGEANLR